MHRRRVLWLFSVLAGLVMTSSAAFACDVFSGTMTVRGDGGGMSQAIGDAAGIVQWCSQTGSSSISKPVGTMHVDVTPYAGNPSSPNPHCVPASQLPDTGALKGPGPRNPAGVGEPLIYTVTWADASVSPDCVNSPVRSFVNPFFGVWQAQRVSATPSVVPTGGGVSAGVSATVSDSFITITNGQGSGDYYIDSSLAGSPSTGLVCVSDSGGAYGNMVPVTFV